MALALFDLDNTLLAGDSDYLWGRFLAERGIVDGDNYERKNRQYYQDYLAGTLDIFEFQSFTLAPLVGRSDAELGRLHADFMAEKIRPIIPSASLELVEKHRKRGDILVIITATNEFITAPIAKEFGIENLIATEVEKGPGGYTGKPRGIPSFQEGKVTRLEIWMKEHNQALADSWFYSDSHNDMPLLERVANPVVVDADKRLKQIAQERNWPSISLREAR